MRPLDRLSSIKFKLGVVIVASVAASVFGVYVGWRAGLPGWVSGGFAILLGLGMIQFLARGMTSPLREMVDASQAMARGDYSRRVTATSSDEVGELARAFNRMATDLAEVDRMRRDLIANVSHELRTPISALQAVLENVADGVADPDPVTLEAMLKQVRRLGGLVEQLLDLSRLEAGTVPLKVRPTSARALLEEAVAEARLRGEQATGSRGGFLVDVKPGGLALKVDPERLHQVLANLLDNAVRHSPELEPIVVRARTNDARARIEVEDRGPGISGDEAARVFERFYRSDAARALSDGGSGLGLAIARWIVDLHGGDIKVEPGEPHGCRVIVELPL